MKYLSLIVAVLLFSNSFAQSFLKKENNNFTLVKSLQQETAYKMDLSGIESIVKNAFPDTEKSVKTDPSKHEIRANGFVLNKNLFAKNLNGAVTYNFSLSLQEHSCKMTFTDFLFQYYEKNDKGQYLPTARFKSLSELEQELSPELFQELLKETERRLDDIISQLNGQIK